MTSGVDQASIGLVTPTLVGSQTCLDDQGPEPVTITDFASTPADHVVEWLFHSDYASMLLDSWGGRRDLLARLFVGAAVGGSNGQPVAGSSLMPGVDSYGTFNTSRWTLTLDMPRDQLDEAVRRITARPVIPADIRASMR